jgi:hypothetical protein
MIRRFDQPGTPVYDSANDPTKNLGGILVWAGTNSTRRHLTARICRPLMKNVAM